ncbi:MAG: putative selenate ABC transporter substrate-binding protein [Candidatus Rokubacteria bacterium RBG_16_73_20]|nr:MAG: putative selenate ABC transporter substrate-binding protein [Candidatus Rokubacteria bacterium GWA2_73_35]OGK96999.1 MAG: putative selenate ABC transporter substrate-binding protein [Candidatus Rokubacteria bacterium RBG_16_73_20]
MTRGSLRGALVALLLATGPTLPGVGEAQVPAVLRIAAIPDENPSELLRIYRPFAEYLARELGMRVRFTPVVDYAATVEGLAAKKLDLVWYGGFTSVQAVRRTQGTAKRLVLREEDAQFRSVFVARPGSSIRRLADLKGRTFAFGSVSSTSGHLMPRYFLLRAGVTPEKDLRQVAFSGAHDATALWVESGKVEAGALNFLVWDKLVLQKKVDRAKVDVFHTTPPYVDYVWTARGDLDPGVQEKLTAAFLKLDYANPEHRRLLDLHRTRKYIKAIDAEWKAVEEAAISAGLLK